MRNRTFMITLSFPQQITESFLRLVPAQRAKIGELLANGRLASFSLNWNRSHAWLVMHAKSVKEVESILETFPMYDYFTYEVEHLLVHDTEYMGLPKLALN